VQSDVCGCFAREVALGGRWRCPVCRPDVVALHLTEVLYVTVLVKMLLTDSKEVYVCVTLFSANEFKYN
jgi:hypothetical protein